jgi:hypothetical protein
MAMCRGMQVSLVQIPSDPRLQYQKERQLSETLVLTIFGLAWLAALYVLDLSFVIYLKYAS